MYAWSERFRGGRNMCVFCILPFHFQTPIWTRSARVRETGTARSICLCSSAGLLPIAGKAQSIVQSDTRDKFREAMRRIYGAGSVSRKGRVGALTSNLAFGFQTGRLVLVSVSPKGIRLHPELLSLENVMPGGLSVMLYLETHIEQRGCCRGGSPQNAARPHDTCTSFAAFKKQRDVGCRVPLHKCFRDSQPCSKR